jgi:hypothetical protein
MLIWERVGVAERKTLGFGRTESSRAGRLFHGSPPAGSREENSSLKGP